MCGRLVQAVSPDEIADHLEALRPPDAPAPQPRFNVAPTTPILIVRLSPEGGRRELISARWGLIPSWSKELPAGAATMNARSETVHEKPTFRAAFKKRRCVVPVSGFYEWKRAGRAGDESSGAAAEKSRGEKSQPFFIYRSDHHPLLLAGLWEAWIAPQTGEEVISATILTTAPNAFMAALHDRMPVVLSEGEVDDWLNPATSTREPLEALMSTREWPGVVMHPVTRSMGRVGFEGPQCVEPIPIEQQPGLF